MSKKISVLIKEPGRVPRHVAISDTLENLQRTVGGYIETVTIASDCVLIVDEEGRIKNKEWCCNIAGIDLYGTVIMCGVCKDEFSDIPAHWNELKVLFPELWEKMK
jgi:hypothetical protein